LEDVEWFKFYKMMGVSEFHIYHGSSLTLDDPDRFNYYTKLGLLKVHEVAPPFTSQNTSPTRKTGGTEVN
jgi:hypothetical protein